MKISDLEFVKSSGYSAGISGMAQAPPGGEHGQADAGERLGDDLHFARRRAQIGVAVVLLGQQCPLSLEVLEAQAARSQPGVERLVILLPEVRQPEPLGQLVDYPGIRPGFSRRIDHLRMRPHLVVPPRPVTDLVVFHPERGRQDDIGQGSRRSHEQVEHHGELDLHERFPGPRLSTKLVMGFVSMKKAARGA